MRKRMKKVACDFFFFFQAEDGIRDDLVTGVQTCALPIYPMASLHPGLEEVKPSDVRLEVRREPQHEDKQATSDQDQHFRWAESAGGCPHEEIGRASCRESVDLGGRRIIKKKKKKSKRS